MNQNFDDDYGHEPKNLIFWFPIHVTFEKGVVFEKIDDLVLQAVLVDCWVHTPIIHKLVQKVDGDLLILETYCIGGLAYSFLGHNDLQMIVHPNLTIFSDNSI